MIRTIITTAFLVIGILALLVCWALAGVYYWKMERCLKARSTPGRRRPKYTATEKALLKSLLIYAALGPGALIVLAVLGSVIRQFLPE